MTGPQQSAFPSAVVVNSAGPNRNIEPDWVLVGWRERGRCHLLASEAVSDASLTFVRQTLHYDSWAEFTAPGAFKPARQLQAIIGNYVLIRADSYAECLAALLFGFQWKPDTIRAIGSAGMGRSAGPSVQTDPAPLCGHRPRGTQLMTCDQPAGHYPETPHAHLVTWDDDPDPGEQLALDGRQDPQ